MWLASWRLISHIFDFGISRSLLDFWRTLCGLGTLDGAMRFLRFLAFVLLLWAAAVCARDVNPYKILDVSPRANDGEIKRAYRKLSLRYHPDKQQGKSAEDVERAQDRFVKIQKAYEVLSDADKRRNYDMTGYADPKDAYTKPGGDSGGRRRGAAPGAAGRGGWDTGGKFGGFGSSQPDPINSETTTLTPQNFAKTVLKSNKPWLVQVYHDGSELCQRVAPVWEQTARAMDGVTRLGRVNIAHYPELAAKVAPLHPFSSSHINPRDLPVVIGFPRTCGAYWCRRKYRGMMKESALSTFAMDRLAGYEEVPALTRESLAAFLEGEPKKVKFVYFSSRAGPASPLLRRAATEYRNDVSVAQVHYKQSEAAYWIRKHGMHTPPAVLVVKEAGEKIVEQDVTGRDKLKALLIEHKLQTLPELRSSSLKSTGCRPGGLARVCVAAVGVEGFDLTTSRDMLRAVKMALQSPSSPSSTLSAALEQKELAMVWVDAKRQKGVREALFAGDGGMPKIVATRFHGGEDKVDLSTYDGAMNRADFTAWMSNVFEGDDAGMVSGVEFPELAADSLGLYERALHFQGSTLSWAQYFGAELVYMSIESGPAVPMGMILTVVMIPMLFQRPKRRKKPVRKRSEMDQDAVIELDDDALECLKEQQMKSLVVMMFIESSEDDQETFKKLRNAFWREPILSFGVVNLRKASGWSEFAESSGAAAGSVLVWHPMRTKFQIIGSGDGSIPHPVLCSQIEKILDGMSSWEDGAWPVQART